MKVKSEPLNILNKKKNALPTSKLIKPKKFKSGMKKVTDLNKAIIKEKVKLATKESSDAITRKVKYSESTDKLQENSRTSHSIMKSKTVGNTITNAQKIASLFDFPASNKNPSPKKKISSNSNLGPKEKKRKQKSSIISIIPKHRPITDESSESTEPINKKPILNLKVKQSSRQESSSITLTNSTTSEEKLSSEISSNCSLENSEKKRNRMSSNISTVNKPGSGESVTVSKYVNKRSLADLKSQKVKHNSSKVLSEQSSHITTIHPKNTSIKEIKKADLSLIKCQLEVNKVKKATKGLLKLINEKSKSQLGLLDEAEPILMQVECVKIPIIPTKQLRFKLPHSLTDETGDVLLITSDLKGHKIYPEKAVDHYEELLAQHHINFINKVMPIRMIRKEYSQYELRRKLVDQFDVILADARIIRSLPAVLGKFIMFARKMPIPVKLDINKDKLKKHLQAAITKTQMTVKSNGHTSIVQVGHSKMKPEEIAANIVKVAQELEGKYPGGWKNVRSLFIKTSRSTALPVYLSLVSPNEIRIPVEVRRKPPPVEGELSTMLGAKVLVTHDGKVILKKVKEEPAIDNSKDDEILEEAEKYIESSKTVRYDESSGEEEGEKSGDSDMEADAVTDAMEQEMLNNYEKNIKSKKKGGEEDEEVDEEEEESEEEELPVTPPVPSKKKKMKDGKSQGSGPSFKKQLKLKDQKGEVKKDNSKGGKEKGASPGLKKPQMRGSRGGKKNKMSKDQRKAMIKRKKAGKK